MLLPDGGIERSALLGLETPRITPGQSLAVESNRRLHNARIRILDEADRALASDDVPEDGPLGLRYRIGLLAPLEPGRRYALLIDPQSGATLDDGTGGELPEQRLEFRTTGERPRSKPPQAANSNAPAAPPGQVKSGPNGRSAAAPAYGKSGRKG